MWTGADNWLLKTNILFSKIIQQTKISMTIPYTHSINICTPNYIILELTLLP